MGCPVDVIKAAFERDARPSSICNPGSRHRKHATHLGFIVWLNLELADAHQIFQRRQAQRDLLSMDGLCPDTIDEQIGLCLAALEFGGREAGWISFSPSCVFTGAGASSALLSLKFLPTSITVNIPLSLCAVPVWKASGIT
jgi:hypothetical protein